MSKVTMILSEEEMIELQEILIDDDEKASLDFLKTRIQPKIPQKGTSLCDSSRKNPFLLK
ncbi:hypothetical protein HQ585_04970 [candidate division KSB1 bacterium]|nr:hypothetical protein [candidate division KSB1 bacterium]